ncbi:hypothetical protein EDB89DRAFT_1912709 [Lactarius sanguifluus]|nr:hypothetical protein EDB89DRAFT_1912709 [Lactarius sanguifluus]
MPLKPLDLAAVGVGVMALWCDVSVAACSVSVVVLRHNVGVGAQHAVPSMRCRVVVLWHDVGVTVCGVGAQHAVLVPSMWYWCCSPAAQHRCRRPSMQCRVVVPWRDVGVAGPAPSISVIVPRHGASVAGPALEMSTSDTREYEYSGEYSNQKYTQDDPQWDREVRGATAVLEDLLEKWKEEPYVRDHVRVGRAVGVIGRHVTPARDLPRTVRKSLDELAPRLRLEFIANASYLIIIAFIIIFALVGHALRIALAVAYGILKTFEHLQGILIYKAPAHVPPRHRIRITAIACRVIAVPLPPSIVSSSSSSSFELALAALSSCRRSPLLNRRRCVVVVIAGVIRCVVVTVGMAVTGCRRRVWDRTYAAEFVVVVVLNVERGKPPWPVATFSTPARISNQSKPCAPQTTNYDYDNTTTTPPTQLRAARTPPAATSTLPTQLRHQQQPWGEARVTAATQPRWANAHRYDDWAMPIDHDSDNESIDYDDGAMPVNLRRRGDGRR